MKILNKIIAVSLISSALTVPVCAEEIFADMSNYGWAVESVEYLYNKGIVEGVSKFKYSPSAQMRRGDFALILYRYYNLEKSSDNYADMDDGMYFSDAVSALKGINAYSEIDFEPNRAITREEAVELIYNTIYNTVGVTETQFSEDASQYYSDANEIKWNRVNAVATLTNMGVIQGDDGKFMPKKTMNRAELAVIMHNIDKLNSPTPPADATPAPDEDVPTQTPVTETIDVSAVSVITTDTSEATKQFSATNNDESVRAVYNSQYNAKSVTLSKSAGISTDPQKSLLFGLNSALYGANAIINLENTSVMTSAENADGVFLAGNSSAEIVNSALVTTADSSSAIGVKNNSSVTFTNTRFSTSGNNSPVMKILEGGNLTANGGFIVTEGSASPGIYSLGKAVINNANISISGDSYAVVVSGNGDVICDSTALSGKGIMLFDDALSSKCTSKFTAQNSTISTTSDCVFYVTNTDSEINLTQNTITVPNGAVLLKAMAGEWGATDANGGHVTMNVQSQTLNGDVLTDNLSSVTLNLLGGVVYRGALNPTNYTGSMNISLSADCHWSLNGDSYVTVFENADTSCSNIISNGFNIVYDPSAEGNKWLNGQIIELNGGGFLKPAY